MFIMDVSVQQLGSPLATATDEYMRKRIERLERYLPSIGSVRVEVREEESKRASKRASVQITVRHQRGAILRSEVAIDGEVEAAFNEALERMYRQIERFKGRRSQKGRERFSATLDEAQAAEAAPIELRDEGEPEPLVVRRKPVLITTMTEEEAIEQMELLGHTFFVYQSADGRQMQVVYKRRDGGYGVLVPALG
jgi:putative sigma-54 modulation protein